MSLDERNEALNKKLDATELPRAVDTLIKDADRRKKQVRLLAFSIALDFVLTIGLSFLSIQTHGIAGRSESNEQAIVRSCEANNESRAKNKIIWSYLLSQPQTQPVPPDQQAQRDRFSKLVNDTFAPRDCNNVVK